MNDLLCHMYIPQSQAHAAVNLWHYSIATFSERIWHLCVFLCWGFSLVCWIVAALVSTETQDHRVAESSLYSYKCHDKCWLNTKISVPLKVVGWVRDGCTECCCALHFSSPFSGELHKVGERLQDLRMLNSLHTNANTRYKTWMLNAEESSRSCKTVCQALKWKRAWKIAEQPCNLKDDREILHLITSAHCGFDSWSKCRNGLKQYFLIRKTADFLAIH